MSCPRLDIFVDADSRSGLYAILETVRPEWNASDVVFGKFSVGTLNEMVQCHTTRNVDDKVVIRVFARKLGDLINRDDEIENVLKLSLRGCAPKMLAIFANGFCYEFYAGECLNVDTLIDPHISKLVANQFATFHCLPLEGERPKFFASLYKVISDLPDGLENLPTVPTVMRPWTKDDYVRETQFLERCVEKIESPVVFCHGDLLPENIIYNKSSDRVMFIDFEFSGFNHQAIDLACHFCEYAGVSKTDYARFPSPEYRKQWLSVYLPLWFREIGKSQEVDQELIERVYEQICTCIPVTHFYVAITTLLMGIRKDDPGLEYTSLRFEQYLKTKHEAMTRCRLDARVNVSQTSDMLRLLKIIKPEWKQSEIILDDLTRGMINDLILCYVTSDVGDKIVLRIYADTQNLFDRESEVQSALELSSRGLAPKMLAVFDNGFCYQYIDGLCLNEDTILEPLMWKMVAKAFAKLHAPATHGERSHFFQLMRDLLVEFPETFEDLVEIPESMKSWTKTDLLGEVDFNEKIVDKLESPVVFCHGDCHPGNILYDKSSDRMLFIDFELSTFDYQAIEISYLFCEFAGMENPDHSKYPNEEFQKQWLEVYWRQWLKETGKPLDFDKDVIDDLYRKVNICVPAIHLMAAIMTPSIEMRIKKPNAKFAESRFKEYLRTKTRLVATSD